MSDKPQAPPAPKPTPPAKPKIPPPQAKAKDEKVKEIGGPEGPEPTRYGDWERKGRVSDF